MKIHPKNQAPTLIGKHHLMSPIQLSDAEKLAPITPLETFKYFVSPAPKLPTVDEFRRLVSYMMDTPSIQGFIIKQANSGQTIGSSSFLDIRMEDAHVEIGMTWYSPKFRGTLTNPECKLLMLQYAFDELGCERVTLKCDDRNEHSKSAIRKLGATYEGTLRKHRITDSGFIRDTSYFSILKEEWPSVKKKLEERLNG